MEKLTLEHLAPYLPYKLRIKGINTPKFKSIELTTDNINNCIHDVNCGYIDDWRKPILHPMSDLKKNNSIDSKTIQIQLLELNNDVSIISYQLHSWLCENHYDVFRLIEKGLAVNYNDIK